MAAEVAGQGYREEEFYVEGAASAYVVQPAQNRATPDAGNPYNFKTRVIVRRPVSAGRFNGTVILEWINASSNSDQENDWLWSHEHLMREGYAYVGVTAERGGIEGTAYGLKKWNAARYGSLNVDAAGKFTANELSYDIYSQVAQALKQPQGVKLLGDLEVRNIIATGHSSSGARLNAYYNAIHPLAGVIDGFVLHGAPGPRIRRDLKTPAWRLLAETDVTRAAALPQADHDYLRTWEVAGAAHADWDLIRVLDSLFARDWAQPPEELKCVKPVLSRVPSHVVQDAVYDWMKLWIEKGTPPPDAPPITMASAGTGRGGSPGVVARDENGNALGGIRLAEFAVPTATNTGVNSGGQYCNIVGSHVPFDAAKLARLYPDRKAYVAAVERITDENLKAGYITREAAARTKQEAQRPKQ
jgi:hypothetical protein